MHEMQAPSSKRGSTSTINHLELHRLSTREDSSTSSPSALVGSNHTAPVNDSYASPLNDASLPWWEAEAEVILRGTDLQAIQLLYRYHTYHSDHTPGSVLRTRWPPILSGLLLRMSSGTFSRRDINVLHVEQQVEEILKRLAPSRSVGVHWDPWASYPALLESEASQVALELEAESLSWFRRVSFSDYIREALYPEKDIDSIEAFKDWHDGLFNQVSDRLASFPDEGVKYAQVEEVSAATTIPLPPKIDLLAAIA